MWRCWSAISACALFQRSTRKVTLTEAGERFLPATRGHLEALQTAIGDVRRRTGASRPARPRLSMGLTFGLRLHPAAAPAFLARYPLVSPDWQLANRQVDLIAEDSTPRSAEASS